MSSHRYRERVPVFRCHGDERAYQEMQRHGPLRGPYPSHSSRTCSVHAWYCRNSDLSAFTFRAAGQGLGCFRWARPVPCAAAVRLDRKASISSKQRRVKRNFIDSSLHWHENAFSHCGEHFVSARCPYKMRVLSMNGEIPYPEEAQLARSLQQMWPNREHESGALRALMCRLGMHSG